MFARMGSRHFAHLYISGLFRLRFGFLSGLGDLAFERRRDDRTVCASREDVTAAPAFPHAGRTTANGDRGASRARVRGLLASSTSLARRPIRPPLRGPNQPTMPPFSLARAPEDL